MTKDSRYLVSGSGDKSIKIWDLRELKEIHHFADVHERILKEIFEKIMKFFIGDIKYLTLTHDDKFIISSSWDKTFKIFDFEKKEEVYHLKNPGDGLFFSLKMTLNY